MKLGIIGASGFSKEVADICLATGMHEVVLLFRDLVESKSNVYQFCNESEISVLSKKGYKFIIGIGDNNIRGQVYNKYKDLNYVNLIHSSATFGYEQKAMIDSGTGNIVTAGARFTNNITIGNFCIFNLNCTIGHDCEIGSFVNIAPGANISGNVIISDYAYVGTGSTILQGSPNNKLIIGYNSVIGAGAVVTRSVPNNTTVKGIPAK